MKKLILVFVALFAMGLVSCNKGNKSAVNAQDSTVVDSTVVDSLSADSVSTDSVK